VISKFWNVCIWVQVCFGCRYEGIGLQFLSFPSYVDKSKTGVFVVSDGSCDWVRFLRRLDKVSRYNFDQ
jgi:hypothetical protein